MATRKDARPSHFTKCVRQFFVFESIRPKKPTDSEVPKKKQEKYCLISPVQSQPGTARSVVMGDHLLPQQLMAYRYSCYYHHPLHDRREHDSPPPPSCGGDGTGIVDDFDDPTMRNQMFTDVDLDRRNEDDDFSVLSRGIIFARRGGLEESSKKTMKKAGEEKTAGIGHTNTGIITRGHSPATGSISCSSSISEDNELSWFHYYENDVSPARTTNEEEEDGVLHREEEELGMVSFESEHSSLRSVFFVLSISLMATL